MRSSKLKLLLSVLLGLSLLSCEKDPYPSVGERDLNPVKTPRKVEPQMSITMKSVYELDEGRKTNIKIKIDVPRGDARIEVDNLPPGASYDEATNLISWTPGMFAGNDPKDPTIKSQIYPVTIWLRSTEDLKEAIKKDINLVVYDVPQNLDINGSTSENATEGSDFSYEFDIVNPDYPTGPFNVVLSNTPANMRLVKVDENNYRMEFKPDYHHVKLTQRSDCRFGSHCKKYESQIIVTNPAGHKTVKDIEIDVLDKRLDVKIVNQKELVNGLDLSFQVSAYDMNGEIAPDLSMTSDEPDYGKFSTEVIEDDINNTSVMNITWKDIPPTYNGKSFDFKFKACVKTSYSSTRNCNYSATTVKIEVKDRNPPIIVRDSWENGKIQYFKFNERKSFKVFVRDGDSRFNDVSNIKIMPESMRKYVSYSASSNTITARFSEAGIHQFSLVATSEYNMSSAESFVAEVFDVNRSKTLYFTDSTRDDEVKFYLNTLKNVQMMNPVLQVLNERNLSGRDTLILGTSILKDKNLKTTIENAMNKIENVVIATPLIENMPKSFLDEISVQNRIGIEGRYDELPNTPKLSELSFVTRFDLPVPSQTVKLKGLSSDESYAPLVFKIGVDRKNCADVLDLTDSKKEKIYKIGLICNRKNNGRYVILGTEFSDILPAQGDEDIAARWLRKMLSTTLNAQDK